MSLNRTNFVGITRHLHLGILIKFVLQLVSKLRVLFIFARFDIHIFGKSEKQIGGPPQAI